MWRAKGVQARRQSFKAAVLSVASSYSQQPESNVITISRIGDARNCLRKYYKNYIEEPREKAPFETIEAGVGTFFHDYLKAHFRRLLAFNRPITAADAIDVNDLLRRFRMSFVWEGRLREPFRIIRAGESIAFFEARVGSISNLFNEFLSSDLVGHRVIGAEGELQIRTDSCYIRGKYDLITASPSGAMILWDWKTGRPPEPRYFDEYAICRHEGSARRVRRMDALQVRRRRRAGTNGLPQGLCFDAIRDVYTHGGEGCP